MPWTKTASLRGVLTPVPLNDAATVTINAASGAKFDVSVTANRAIALPTNGVDGQEITLRITASGGARSPVFNAGYELGMNVASRTLNITSGATAYAKLECRGGTTWRILAVD